MCIETHTKPTNKSQLKTAITTKQEYFYFQLLHFLVCLGNRVQGHHFSREVYKTSSEESVTCLGCPASKWPVGLLASPPPNTPFPWSPSTPSPSWQVPEVCSITERMHLPLTAWNREFSLQFSNLGLWLWVLPSLLRLSPPLKRKVILNPRSVLCLTCRKVGHSQGPCSWAVGCTTVYYTSGGFYCWPLWCCQLGERT